MNESKFEGDPLREELVANFIAFAKEKCGMDLNRWNFLPHRTPELTEAWNKDDDEKELFLRNMIAEQTADIPDSETPIEPQLSEKKKASSQFGGVKPFDPELEKNVLNALRIKKILSKTS